MVYNIVVAMVNTAAVGAVAQGLIGGLDRIFHTENRAYPVAAVHEPGLLAGNINPFSVEDTLVLHLTAAKTVFGGAFRSTLLFEQVNAAYR